MFFLSCCIAASWLLSHMYHSYYTNFSWCQTIKKGLSTICCQILRKFSIGKGKWKGIGIWIIWELHLGMGQNRTKPFKNRIDKLRMERWKNQTEGKRNIWGIILTLLDTVDSSEINKGLRSCPRRHRSAHWKENPHCCISKCNLKTFS